MNPFDAIEVLDCPICGGPGVMFDEGGCDQIASSRLEQLYEVKKAGITKPTLLLRIPMLTEIENVAQLCDVTLISEIATMDALNAECLKQGKKIKVIVMVDLGDLREGFWDREELVAACAHIENDLKNLELAGVGTNLGCYGSIQPTVEKMEELAENGTAYSGKCYICHSACYEDARAVADMIEAAFPKMNGKVLINSIGTTIGSHTGKGTVALFFWGDERVD